MHVIKNYSDIIIDNIKLSKRVGIGNGKDKINIGYDNNPYLYIYTCKLINNYIYNDGSTYIKVLFDPLLGEIEQFYNFMSELDDIAKSVIKDKKYSYCSMIKKMSYDDDINTMEYMYINLQKYNNNKMYKIYGDMNEEITLNELKMNYNYKMILNIDNIWIDKNKKRYGLNINLLQMKVYKPLYETICMIDNEKKEYNMIIQPINQINVEHQPVLKTNNSYIKPSINVKELLDVKNMLKKVL